MYLYGASGHAKVIIDILQSNNIIIEALYDDNNSVNRLMSYPVLRPKDVKGPLLISIGNNRIRKTIVEKLNVEYGCAIHPLSIISSQVKIGEGSVVMQGAIIQTEVCIGKHCIVNTGASIDHECTISDYVHISPHSTICGNVKIGEGSWIGAGSIIIPGIKIGRWSIIGAGSVVVEDIPDGVLALGNPCRIIKKECEI